MLASLSKRSLTLPGLASDWEIDPDELVIERRADGTEWELGSGASAKVRLFWHPCFISSSWLVLHVGICVSSGLFVGASTCGLCMRVTQEVVCGPSFASLVRRLLGLLLQNWFVSFSARGRCTRRPGTACRPWPSRSSPTRCPVSCCSTSTWPVDPHA
jgi:hypothetical protein